MKLPTLLLSCVCLCGCERPENVHINDTIVQDQQGNLYRLKYNIGDTFFIEQLPTNITFKPTK